MKNFDRIKNHHAENLFYESSINYRQDPYNGLGLYKPVDQNGGSIMIDRDEIKKYATELWHYHQLKHLIDLPVDCIIGLGSYDLAVVDRCVELFNNKLSSLLVFTGESGNWTKDLWNRTEAEIFAEKAMSSGVPLESILLEKTAKNIGENILFSKNILLEKKPDSKSIVIVTKPNTERRAYAACKKIWPEIEVKITSFSKRIDFIDRQYDHLIHEMVGDLERILVYPEKGYQIKQEVSDEVMQAYHALIAYGFTEHMMEKPMPSNSLAYNF